MAFLPICTQFGMDPVQFGMVMLINCALGLNTPPVGTTQFVGCAIGGVSIGYVMRTIWPFYGALIAALMLAAPWLLTTGLGDRLVAAGRMAFITSADDTSSLR